MPDNIIIPNTCNVCGGEGVSPDGSVCETCLGASALPITGERLIHKLHAKKLDAVLSEQVAQRADLTAALTAIWDKVKGL